MAEDNDVRKRGESEGGRREGGGKERQGGVMRWKEEEGGERKRDSHP